MIFASLLPSASLWAANDVSDFRVFTYKVDATREPKNVLEEPAKILRNPIVGAIVIGAAIYLGAPPEAVAAVATVASAPDFDKRSEETNYRFPIPKEYLLCAANFNLKSIVPASGERASFVAASGTANMVNVYTWTPVRAAGEGRSWVDMDIGILAVKADRANAHRGKCADLNKPQSFFSCRGTDCPVADGRWLREGDIGADGDAAAAVGVVMRLMIPTK